jgi:hypothetical protein
MPHHPSNHPLSNPAEPQEHGVVAALGSGSSWGFFWLRYPCFCTQELLGISARDGWPRPAHNLSDA